MYATGEGVPRDDGEAARWYRVAADQGYDKAKFSLGGQCWRLEKLAYRTPLEAREQYELRHAA